MFLGSPTLGSSNLGTHKCSLIHGDLHPCGFLLRLDLSSNLIAKHRRVVLFDVPPAITEDTHEVAIPKLETYFVSRGKSHAPDTFQLGAILPTLACLGYRKVNNLRVFIGSECFDSARLHQLHTFGVRAAESLLGASFRFCCLLFPDSWVVRSFQATGPSGPRLGQFPRWRSGRRLHWPSTVW
jgi:hypothetical protein